MKEEDVQDIISLLHTIQDDLKVLARAQQTSNTNLFSKAKKECLALHTEVGKRL